MYSVVGVQISFVSSGPIQVEIKFVHTGGSDFQVSVLTKCAVKNNNNSNNNNNNNNSNNSN